jgi:3-oxoacyl-[acyl-carrier-protein] synthase II
MREVVVTGLGLVSSAGEGVEAHRNALRPGFSPRLDTERFAPYPVYPAVVLDLDRQIPKKADQRQMEPWQRLGVYAAGLALDAAGAKNDPALKSRMQMFVAAGRGERDNSFDERTLSGALQAGDPDVFLNERLMSDLRPTLSLAQLTNLVAGNISVVHGVTGASLTFMGEEQSGIDALRIAHARIASGQTDIALVGGSSNAERADMLVACAMGGYLWSGPFASVWERSAQGGGFILGSGAVFMVLEAREHARARGVTPLAVVAGVAAERTRREPGDVEPALKRLWREVGAGSRQVVVSGATGVSGITQAEQGVLVELAPGARLHATGDVVGHTMEAQAPFSVALAAALVAAGEAGEAVATSVGHWRGEGVVRLTAAHP